MTGRYGTRMNTVGAFGPGAKEATSLDETTLGQIFKAKGYKTHAIGKWHLGGEPAYMPTSRGFDSYFGLNWSVDMNPHPLYRDLTELEKNTDISLLTPRYTEEALKIIEKDAKDPFFLYFGFAFPHEPPSPSPRFKDKTGFGNQGDAIAEIDWAVGEIMKKLDEKGLTKDTLVLFTADHGPWFQGCPGALRGRKASTFEGGFRVPFLAKLPGVIPAGAVNDSPESHLDVMPTLAAMCGLTLPEKPMDGLDHSASWMGKGKAPENTQIYFSPMSKQGVMPHCIRKGDWKVRVAQAYGGEIYINDSGSHGTAWLANAEMYNVRTDPGESYNIAPLHQDVVKSMIAELDEHMKTFPQYVQDDYAFLKANPDRPNTPVAAAPRFPADSPMSPKAK